MNKKLFKVQSIFATLFILIHLLAASAMAENLKVKLLAINDFHGQIGADKTVAGKPAGSAPVLATYLKNAQFGMEDRTIIVSAGDLVGASPADSALLQDEPSIMFINTLANSFCAKKMNPRCNIVATVGNHEFDEGYAEILRLINGGNYPGKATGANAGPFLENPYSGAHFPVVVANVINKANGKTILPPYVIKKIHGAQIAFIGIDLKEAPKIVTPAGVAGLAFLDEADTINKYVRELHRKGVRIIIPVIHQGGSQSGPAITGDIVPIINRLDGGISVVISGHSHSYLNGLLKNAAGKDVLVTQASSSGTAFASINLEIDPKKKEIVKKSAAINTTWVNSPDGTPAVTPDPEVTALVAAADDKVAPIVNTVVGKVTQSITRAQNNAGESALGNLIADAQRSCEGTDFAFMNPGGIRNNLNYNAALGGDITWGDLFSVQPFSNQMVIMTMTGQQIYDLLSQQWSNPSSPKMLQISGLTYSWTLDSASNKGSVSQVLKNGAPLDRSATYTVTANNYLAGGGDEFAVFNSALNKVVDAVDIDVLVKYVKSREQPLKAGIDGRITLQTTP